MQADSMTSQPEARTYIECLFFRVDVLKNSFQLHTHSRSICWGVDCLNCFACAPLPSQKLLRKCIGMLALESPIAVTCSIVFELCLKIFGLVCTYSPGTPDPQVRWYSESGSERRNDLSNKPCSPYSGNECSGGCRVSSCHQNRFYWARHSIWDLSRDRSP